MKYRIELTRQYLRDLKLARKRNLNEEKLNTIIFKLANGLPLPASNRDHPLTGNFSGYRECHISPDWLLIYSLSETLKVITLYRTGSHSDLF